MTRVIVIILLLWVYYIGYLMWWVYSDNQCEDEIAELKDQIDWRQDQARAIADDRTQMKRKFNDKISELNKEMNWYKELLEKYDERFGPYKQSIAEMYKQQIIEWYKEWKSCKKIAEEIGCWTSTVQRAVKKRWLKR